jgi:hypothetical protein
MHRSTTSDTMDDFGKIETELEELQAITRMVFFARASAASIQSEEVVYCLDLALQQLAKEVKQRATHWPEMSAFVAPNVVRQ